MPYVVLGLLVLLGGLASASAGPDQDRPSHDLVDGIAAYNMGDFATAERLLQSATDRGEPEAMVNLGYMYARGQGVARDADFALQLYRRAADAGDAEGMNAVGYRYNFAEKPDLPKAIHWYCMALYRGNQRAMNNLALLFYNGQGLPQDREEARHLWRQAAARGSVNAKTNLGLDIASDAELPQPERQVGVQMLRDAALGGGVRAQEILRKSGDNEPFPPATVNELTMVLEPRNPVPGTSRVCGDVIS